MSACSHLVPCEHNKAARNCVCTKVGGYWVGVDDADDAHICKRFYESLCRSRWKYKSFVHMSCVVWCVFVCVSGDKMHKPPRPRVFCYMLTQHLCCSYSDCVCTATHTLVRNWTTSASVSVILV